MSCPRVSCSCLLFLLFKQPNTQALQHILSITPIKVIKIQDAKIRYARFSLLLNLSFFVFLFCVGSGVGAGVVGAGVGFGVVGAGVGAGVVGAGVGFGVGGAGVGAGVGFGVGAGVGAGVGTQSGEFAVNVPL